MSLWHTDKFWHNIWNHFQLWGWYVCCKKMCYQSQNRSTFGSSSHGRWQGWQMLDNQASLTTDHDHQSLKAQTGPERFFLCLKSGVSSQKSSQYLCNSAVHTEPRISQRLSSDHIDIGRKLEDNWMTKHLIHSLKKNVILEFRNMGVGQYRMKYPSVVIDQNYVSYSCVIVKAIHIILSF